MSNLIAGSFMAFSSRGDVELASDPVLVELTDFQENGEIELAFDAEGLAKTPRIYLRFSLPEVIRQAMIEHGAKE